MVACRARGGRAPSAAAASLDTNCPILRVVTIAARVVTAPLYKPAYSLASRRFCRSRMHFLGYRFSGIFPAGAARLRDVPQLASDVCLAGR